MPITRPTHRGARKNMSRCAMELMVTSNRPSAISKEEPLIPGIIFDIASSTPQTANTIMLAML